MTIEKIGPNVQEIHFADGVRVLVSYETPVAAYIPPAAGVNVPQVGWVKSESFYSRTTSKHIGAWLRANGAAENVQRIGKHELTILLGGR